MDWHAGIKCLRLAITTPGEHDQSDDAHHHPPTTSILTAVITHRQQTRNIYLLGEKRDMALMLRSLVSSFNAERSPLPCIDPIPLPLSRTSSRTDGGKVKRTPEPVRASPYPPLKRSSPGLASATGPRRAQPLKRTTSLHGGDSLASLQRAATELRSQSMCKPPTNHKRRQTNGPLRPALSLANTLVLDPLVCPPPVPIARNTIHLHAPVIVPPAPKPPIPTIFSQLGVRRRSSLAPEAGAPTALVPRTSHVPLPSPPSVLAIKKKRESLAQRTIRRQFERTPRGAQVKTLGAHAAVRIMSEAEEEAAVAAVVVVDDTSDSEDVCMSDAWVQVAPAHEEMEWSLIDGDQF
ncbi:unnamed protein product [Rhizoctonia solani]|uniref:Uncharacterized protein n=1 Tax=Rhizoctonia solani TaxID=456999 RepID=A0A8H3C6X0_9AGAM|nr:unnamed protein product [Rhizoctonia solani]